MPQEDMKKPGSLLRRRISVGEGVGGEREEEEKGRRMGEIGR